MNGFARIISNLAYNLPTMLSGTGCGNDNTEHEFNKASSVIDLI